MICYVSYYFNLKNKSLSYKPTLFKFMIWIVEKEIEIFLRTKIIITIISLYNKRINKKLKEKRT